LLTRQPKRRAIAAKLEDEYETAQLDLKVKAARSDAITEAVNELEAKAELTGNSDPVVLELQRIVDIREKELKSARDARASAVASESDLDNAEVAAAQARMQLLQQKAASASAAGGDVVAGWNHELLSLSIDLAEARARAQAIKEELGGIHTAMGELESSPSLAALENTIAEQQGKIPQLTDQINADQQRLSPSAAPTITVTDTNAAQ